MAVSSISSDPPIFNQFIFRDLQQIPRQEIPSLLQDLQRLERKSFPSKEVYSFENSILKRRNTAIFVALSNAPSKGRLAAYTICVKCNHKLLLHKICVSAAYRCQGLGFLMLSMLIDRARTQSCRAIDLWVRSDNHSALGLYTKFEFLPQDTIVDYYAPGKTGIKMSHSLRP